MAPVVASSSSRVARRSPVEQLPTSGPPAPARDRQEAAEAALAEARRKLTGAAKRKGSREHVEAAENGKAAGREKKEKKREKEKKEKKKGPKKVEINDSDLSGEDKEVGGAHTIVRAAPTARAPRGSDDSDTVSQDSDRGRGAKRPAPPGRSSLKRRRAADRRGHVAGRIRFAGDGEGGRPLVREVAVVSYRALSEELWFTNPQANVLCERCKRRVPNKMGQLRGGNGGSSFMCCEFLCSECYNDL